ncbi:MAG: hypothetical protein ACYDH4_11315 [Candidatus Cryosericum sp.]
MKITSRSAAVRAARKAARTTYQMGRDPYPISEARWRSVWTGEYHRAMKQLVAAHGVPRIGGSPLKKTKHRRSR